MYLKLTFFFLIDFGFLGTSNKLALIEHHVNFHFISITDCSFVFTAALKKKGLERIEHDKQLEKNKRKRIACLYTSKLYFMDVILLIAHTSLELKLTFETYPK